ncbi:MAG: hypothetical protein RIT81_10490 [Deltaproteobacteria bacterium]
MQTSTTTPSIPAAATTNSSAKPARILARTIFKDMKGYGVSNQKIIEVASELIGLVTDQLREDGVDKGRA